MADLIDQKDFFKKYKISEEEFEKSKLEWSLLETIYDSYVLEIPNLEASAVYIFNSLMKTENVHSVRYRVKDAEHVIEKIIRKSIIDPTLEFTVENYKEQLTDLIGLRALHLFKDEWKQIHDSILNTWNLKGPGVINYRDGDLVEDALKLQEVGLETKIHRYGYRSIHYIIETTPAKVKYYAEIQVRTIFEEAWSEIDHTIRYPYDQDNQIFGQFLLILNRLAGSADEMGTYVSFLKASLTQRDNEHAEAIIAKDDIIKSLRDKISELNLPKEQSSFFNEGFNKLATGMPLIDTSKLYATSAIAKSTAEILSSLSRQSDRISILSALHSPSAIDLESKIGKGAGINWEAIKSVATKPEVSSQVDKGSSKKKNKLPPEQ